MGFCNDITPNCDTCYDAIYGECNDVITLSLGLTPLTTYYLDLIDKFDIVTPLTVITDGAGDFTITQTWTQFFGAIELQIYSDSARTVLVSFIIGGTSYNCVILGNPSICNNILDFSESCNSQYITL